jgi:hypothetical protein
MPHSLQRYQNHDYIIITIISLLELRLQRYQNCSVTRITALLELRLQRY